jgi:MFS family permease
MLTAKASESDRVTGLDLGADDYITKPFSVRELLARVRAVMRRADETMGKTYEDDHLLIDFDDIRVACDGVKIKLTNKEFTLLSVLARSADRVVTRQQLLDSVWGYSYYGDARTLGLLMSATGLGALSGALFLAARESVRGLSRVITAAASLLGISLIAFAFSRSLPLSMGLLVLAGFGMMVQMAASNTFLQTVVDDDKRGRVMSFFSMAFLGMSPFGSLLAGTLADRIGPSPTVAITGFACLAASLFFAFRLPALRALVRPIYIRKGILPEVATGLQSATDGAESPTSH